LFRVSCKLFSNETHERRDKNLRAATAGSEKLNLGKMFYF
jgi:hypothetical protein